MAQISFEALEAELQRLIETRRREATMASRNSRQKLLARATELSNLLGWLRKEYNA